MSAKDITKVIIAGLVGIQMLTSPVFAQKQPKPKPFEPLSAEGGKLVYSAYPNGDRIPDFSYAGYKAGEEAIPNLPVKVVVPVKPGDATLRIQSALDYVASLPADKSGFRGAVLLEKGKYEVGGALQIKASGVVLRGSGVNNGTVLLGTGYDRQTLITLGGKGDQRLGAQVNITDAYVPVSSVKINVSNPNAFKVGDHIQIRRNSTKAWIDVLGTQTFGGGLSSLGWKPGQRDILFDRKITAINGSVITLDVPLTTSLDTAYGVGTVSKYTWPGRIANAGVENIHLRSSFDASNPKDEDHRWMAIVIENAMDAWVRQVNFEHFAGSAVNVQESAKRVTVEDCKSLAPVSEIGGQRRYTFMTAGQQTLFQRCYAEAGYHDFAVGFCAAGPNVFVQCESHLPYSFSGPVDSWASGVLFDIVNVDGQALSYKNLEQDGQGAGWNAANSVFWQCTASRVDNYEPPTAHNWAFGTWAQFAGDGYWTMSNEQIQPRSLYYAQLKERIGDKLGNRAIVIPVGTEASSSPPVDVAMSLTKLSATPAITLTSFIDDAAERQPIPVSYSKVKTIDQIGVVQPAPAPKAGVFHIQNGWLVRGDEVVAGRRREVPWWNGSSRPYGLKAPKPHVTRFVPGQVGEGLTDDLNAMTDSMKAGNVVALDHNYGLWYERRRDDHERIRRMDGDVWPPFYELPFARSGKESAWDGLSKYDLTKYNHWYWNRLKQYADLADQKGLVLLHENYFQHNIIEAGAHYADFPWRPVNNINNTGFPEPVPYAGDKRVFMAEQFYDISNPVRRELHRAYIRKSLENFTENNGVIQLISAEYTGPLHFVQFWVDVIKEWEKETGKKALIGLSTTKDVQDAILADKERASVIDVIDIKYWHYQADEKAYEPKGGQNLAPRQHARLLKPKASSFDQVYRAVSEYRIQNPGKAVIYGGDGADSYGWAVFMAGGSLPSIPKTPKAFLIDASEMTPAKLSKEVARQYVLSSKNKGYIVYTTSSEPIKLDLANANYNVRWIDSRTGVEIGKAEKIKGAANTVLSSPKAGAVLWLTK
ncbi:DUF6298 domain-containing protein [Desertivirga brevis]|uniref:DUF6298 domain-containing protein n=1 Tax=Desertivirga brevis TaxID=2810310 RepID=UPI001F62361D|nr:DUF6298 domain-containing protein [Pedobacter sp. SYSU D00873]